MESRVKVVLRADASLQMGTGHVMRCLTLADALKAQGAECHFICREQPGNLIEQIKSKGYNVHVLVPTGASVLTDKESTAEPRLAHAAWLGATQQQDAEQCATILSELQPCWLIVDHYALDIRWERALQPYYRKLMVIDDLADRHHSCDLLLDQTFGRNPQAYEPWVPTNCTLLCGSQYALLRPEFAELRMYSLERRKTAQLEHLLITMGGVDKDNATGQVLKALETSELPENFRITVVMGASAPWLEDVHQQAEQLPWQTKVLVNVSDMAQLMANSDLAIGAAGSTSWERCVMGLPTVSVVTADNQKTIASKLQLAGAVQTIGLPIAADRLYRSLAFWLADRGAYINAARASSNICDGHGASRVCIELVPS